MNRVASPVHRVPFRRLQPPIIQAGANIPKVLKLSGSCGREQSCLRSAAVGVRPTGAQAIHNNKPKHKNRCASASAVPTGLEPCKIPGNPGGHKGRPYQTGLLGLPIVRAYVYVVGATLVVARI